MARSKGCLIATGVIGIAFLAATPWLIQVSLAVADAKKAGFLDEEKTDKYQVGRENNLKAIHKALMQAADSDGTFPPAKTWMDGAMLRLKTGDLSVEEAKDKLKVPGGKPGEFGYSLNTEVAGKTPDDFKSKPGTILVFESTDTKWNASGDPGATGRPGGKAITIDGKVLGK